MNKNIGVFIGIIAVVVVATVIYGGTNRADDARLTENKMESSVMMEQNDQAMMQKNEINQEGSMMVKAGESMVKEDAMMKIGSYEAYAPEKIAHLAASGNVVLFFRASWCPTCRGLDTDIRANLKNIPGNLTILDVDYDNSTDLKKKYGVTYQHTMVQVDKNGVMIKKWMGSPTFAAFVAEVK